MLSILRRNRHWKVNRQALELTTIEVHFAIHNPPLDLSESVTAHLAPERIKVEVAEKPFEPITPAYALYKFPGTLWTLQAFHFASLRFLTFETSN
jgi:hypothetical protein